MSPRRNTFIRYVASISGDIAVGAAVAAACVWVIEAAALSVFLGFLVWLLGTLIALALSQYVVHPLINAVLSERKLDRAIDAMTGLAGVAVEASDQAATGIARCMQQAFTTMRSNKPAW